jgi:hypothetical protein
VAKPEGDGEAHIRAYKTILNAVVDQRPSGTRQRLANALGKHRSFVTQITSPGYTTPIPHRHVATIISVCHFSAAEREQFLAAYRLAHGGAGGLGDATSANRHLSLSVPDLGSDKSNAAFDHAITDFVTRMSGLIRKSEGDK